MLKEYGYWADILIFIIFDIRLDPGYIRAVNGACETSSVASGVV